MIGFDENRGNQLWSRTAGLPASCEEPILGREAKLDTLLEFARRSAAAGNARGR